MMIVRAQILDETAFGSYLELLMQLHRLIAAGKGDSGDADSLRDHMDVFWNQMSEEELLVAGQLSEDLYVIYEAETKHPHKFDIYTQSLASELSIAKESGNFLKALQLLNRRSNEISFDRAMLIRGMCYRDLGLPEIGLQFINRAAETSNDPESAYAIALNTLMRHVDAKLAAAKAIELLQQKDVLSSQLKFIIAGILLETATKASSLTRKEYSTIAKDLFVDLVHKTQKDSGSKLARSYELLSHSYFLLGETQQAVQELTNAIQIAPADEGLYVQSGLMKLDSDFASAKEDFAKAERLGSAFVWPYYYLAFDALSSKDYERTLYLATEALKKPADLDVQGNLHSWIAMSVASVNSELDQSIIDIIRHHFRVGMMLSPTNQSILANLEIFENALQHALIQQGWNVDRPVAAITATESAITKRLPELVPCN